MKKDLSQLKFLILGYAVTGQSVAQYLIEQGADITINDRGDLSQDPSVHLLIDQGARVVDGGHPLSLLDENFDYIVKNPGIPYQIDFLQEAIRRNYQIITDIELASWISQAPIIAVTGSNGKTTTASLIHQLLEVGLAGGSSYLAGNIGIPSLQVAQQAGLDDRIVMEVSSFQLKGTLNFHPQIAVITNLYPAHLDYHESMEDYVASKLRIIAQQSAHDYLVYNYDQGLPEEVLANYPGHLVPFGIKGLDDYLRQHGSYLEASTLYYQGQVMAKLADIQLPGQHNVENVLAALAVAGIFGLQATDIQSVLRLFQGMPHRIQLVAQYQGVDFYNDSKATNMTATITALKSFDQDILYIGGGLDRGNEFDDLIPYLSQVKAAYLYGQSKHKMAKAFQAAKVEDLVLVETVEEATQLAFDHAQSGQIVLFSPANASWDQFDNFEVRGDCFVQLVRQLIQKEEA